MIRIFATLWGVLAIAACTSVAAPTRSVSLAQGEIIATSPVGYCVDDVSSQLANDFAILAPCVTLGLTDVVVPDLIGVVTVQIGPVGSGQAAADELALRDFLITDDGASLLSQSGDGQGVEIISTQAFESQVMVHFSDQGPPPLAGLQSEEWRAFKNINGRLVTIGVRGLAIAPLQEGPGATLLKRILAGVQPVAEEVIEITPDV